MYRTKLQNNVCTFILYRCDFKRKRVDDDVPVK